jgi:membrane protein YdbS with pleckstrin-like domain
MATLNPKVVIVFFIKYFIETAYIIPLWFIAVFILEKAWINNWVMLPKDITISLLDGGGIIFCALLVFSCYCWAWLRFVTFTYELQPDGFHIRKGVIFRRHSTIPYSDIENAELLINPFIVRALQLYSLQITTHEVMNTEGVFKRKQTQIIPGLTADAASTLRSELLKDSHVQLVKKTFFDPKSGHYK